MNKKIKVTHIIDSLGVGGAERLLLDLCKNIDRQKFEVSIITVVRGGLLIKEFEKLKIPVHVCRKKTKLGLFTFLCIHKQLKKQKPDIVHTHLFGGDTWGRLAALRAGVSNIVSTEHNINVDEGKVKHFIKRKLNQRTNKIICISQAVRKYVQNYCRTSRSKTELIYNGVDTEQFKAIDPPEKIKKIGIIGRLETQKGHQVLLKALQLIPAKLEVDIIGRGSLLEALKKEAEKLKQHKINFLGQVEPDQVKKHLAKLDLVVVPSIWEGLNLAAIEASLMQRPLVGSKIPGLDEVILNQKTGVLVEPGNPLMLAAGITLMIKDPKTAKKYALAARKHALKQFDLQDMVYHYQKLYEDLTD